MIIFDNINIMKFIMADFVVLLCLQLRFVVSVTKSTEQICLVRENLLVGCLVFAASL